MPSCPTTCRSLLEFAALTDREAGWKLLTDHRVSIELLHAPAKRKSRWLPVVESLRATLPVLDGTDEALARPHRRGPAECGRSASTAPSIPVAVPQSGSADAFHPGPQSLGIHDSRGPALMSTFSG